MASKGLINSEESDSATRRRGSIAVEEVMLLAAMLPITAAGYFLAVRFFGAAYELIAVLTGWPFL